jgi:hypothetical protein
MRPTETCAASSFPYHKYMQTRGLLGLIFILLTVAIPSVRADEVQQHGLVFETWIRDTFFDGYKPPGYTQKWDIPAEANRRHGGVPVNPKAAKYRTPVDLGDALRQYDIAEPFILVVGFWIQDGGEKRFVNIVAPQITPEAWRKLWGPVTRADLEKLDAIIKDKSLDYREARKQAHAMKSRPPFTEAIIQVNPKIDSKSQRRLQCSLRSDDLFKHLAPDAPTGVLKTPSLWGVPFTSTVTSGSRSFAK